ncbi:MAG TPA: RNA pseudouridine synthase [Stellaceae bacterium]|jgi:tRNA pseudouridine32 synthase/23S rRNA pseudouridine746 synthase|nr:RNA pseudouridine synthase [Stellaceae bacterium]
MTGRSAPSTSKPDTPPPGSALPDWLRARILHLDAQLLVIDKPAGLAVHPGPKTPESLEDFLPALRFGIQPLPQPAHRLDRDTSGCLALGRMPKAVSKLGRLFETSQVSKLYWAIVEGAPAERQGRVDLALAKRNDPNGWRMVAAPGGSAAITDYHVMAEGGGISLLALRPHTGRTHQIRVHCQALDCPVLGDPIYGRARQGQPHMLHARALTLPWGPDKQPLTFRAPLPAHMAAILSSHGLDMPGMEG